jgi:hypothetical protein
MEDALLRAFDFECRSDCCQNPKTAKKKAGLNIFKLVYKTAQLCMKSSKIMQRAVSGVFSPLPPGPGTGNRVPSQSQTRARERRESKTEFVDHIVDKVSSTLS